MAIGSDVDICNMALSHLGNYGTINSISTPRNDKERVFALWYDISRQSLLKLTMPNFALARKLVSELVATIPFGYDNCFEYPSDCLKVLGLGEISQKADYAYSIERHPTNEGLAIYTDDNWTDGLQLRYIKDVTDVNSFSPEFKMLLSWYLAGNVAMDITQDSNKMITIEKILPSKMSELSGMNAQENKPIRISNSLFKQARNSYVQRNPIRK